MKMTTINIYGMEFYAYHGCFEEEQSIGTRFLVDLSLSYDAEKAVLDDNVENAINYQMVYKAIQDVMNKPKHLIETVADGIIKNVKKNFPSITYIEVIVKKLNPPLDGKTEFVSVKMAEKCL